MLVIADLMLAKRPSAAINAETAVYSRACCTAYVNKNIDDKLDLHMQFVGDMRC